ncbi:histidinol-phosphate aminotransferase [Steroidobacter agaridevorans]|uniref:Histidinol-phosphate aminotransferase n=1 Tax=Steroidobacter agaridevorans TaxID=2695856 RepID=A0A829YFZ3_9GAMM|nr:histidinol-phosphate transaminase [Steroidobacter agaridevorans]GFE82247.1 histidinol-phosphate aminotransferase [Steroidobacter agaridevorans]GFE85365.1 histidinol-phosphate aminotransferase [Steroidobacter agaridevorans]
MSKQNLSQAEPFFNPHVEALPKYNAGLTLASARAASGLERIARLASNENPYGCSPAVQQALADGAVELWRYSDPSCELLRAALGKRLDVELGNIVVGNGSEEMIAAASRAFLTAGGIALTVAPCFGLHEIEPLAVGASVTKIPMTAELDFDVTGLEAALAQAPNILFLPSPWNPVGAALDRDGLARLIEAAPATTLFVLDEAYREFVSDAIPDGLEMLRRTQRPYIVLRTFSKAFGLAGLRVGYAVCSSPRIAKMLAAAKTPFNVNAMAQAAAVAALGDEAWMNAAVNRLTVERDRVSKALRNLGLRVARSEGNFLFFDAARDSAQLATALLKAGVVVKPWLEPGYRTFIRVSTGTVAENDQFLDALRAIVR